MDHADAELTTAIQELRALKKKKSAERNTRLSLDYYSSEDLYRIFKFKKATLQRKINNGEFSPGTMLGGRRRWWLKSEIHDILQKRIDQLVCELDRLKGGGH